MSNMFKFCGQTSIIVVRLTLILGFTKSTLASHNTLQNPSFLPSITPQHHIKRGSVI
jgi:hypothetical protein